ncbi:MAG: MarR family transcriptional regulator [Acidimicrobiales bacterium]|nr:MarR family transcriptional regulator [Acidimicrobiales bacterium]
MTDVTKPRWLNHDQEEAWHGIRAIIFRAFPEIERSLKAHDLLGVHYHIFAVLSGAPDQTLRLSELADSANMSQSRLTHRLRTLVDRGEVTICEDPDDRRAKNATLTPAGRKRLEQLAPIHVEDVQRLIFDPLSPEQTKALADAMSTLAEHLCEHPEFLNPQSS